MRKIVLAALLITSIFSVFSEAQETYFGKNKVRYKDFDWSYIQTRHFDIYFYEDAYPTSKFTATVLESSYVEVSKELNYKIQKRIPVFVYNSHNDFQQTNIISSLIPEGVGGFTEAFKNRIVIPFSGSYEDFRHVLHHELTHAVVYDLLYGNMFTSLLSRQRLFSLPLWFAEGFAEYSSRHGWDYFSDMFVRDATINNYLAPPKYLGGFLAYKEGQALIKYIADTYGEDKLGLILKKGKILLTLNKALKEAIGKTEDELWEEFSKEMKRHYWPDIANRKEPDEISKQLTNARKDGSYFNEKPAFSPDGDKIAIFTDKSDYTEIVLISAHNGKILKRLVKGERSGDLESLHSFVSGISFSPDGQELVFVAKSHGSPTLMIYNLKKNNIYQKKKFDFYNILSPIWSPDAKKIAFSALKGDKRDIYIYHLESDALEQLTDDRYDDKDPSWLPNSNELVFSSDRPHPTSVMDDGKLNPYTSEGAYLPGDFKYGFYNLFRIELAGYNITPLDFGPGQNIGPDVSPDGSKVAFISNRNGIDNIYIGYLDSSKYFAVTDILTGVRTLSWSPDGEKIAFSAFNEGAFDIFVMKDIIPTGESGVISKSDFALGKYNLLKKEQANELLVEHKEIHQGNIENELPDIPTREDSAMDADNQSLAEEDVDSTFTDSSAAVEDIDSTLTATTKEDDDSLITETGIYDEEFVFVSKKSKSPFDSLLVDVDGKSKPYPGGFVMDEPASFDSIPGPNAGGNYKIHKYKVKFTPDYMGGGLSYNTFFGLRGQSFFVFSDYLGNHQIFLATDLVNTIDQSNVQLFYFYNRKRANFGGGFFHTKNFYLDNNDFLFSDRFYGLQGFLNYPFSIFKRVELTFSQYFIDRQYYDFNDPRRLNGGRSSKITTAEASYIIDNIIWGITGPINGRRAKLSFSGGKNLFDAKDIEYTAVDFDYRKYWHLKKTYSFAFRFSGGVSFGTTPKLYFLGGTTNWIGNRTLDARVYEVENLYFADVVTPLRGVPYYELSGNRYGLLNAEFRFPLIDYFAMRFPLPLTISRVQGVFFTDIGAAWFGDNFKGATGEGGNNRLNDIKFGFGVGMRMNLGFFLLRYDLAWTTDFYQISDRPSYYFSFGADF